MLRLVTVIDAVKSHRRELLRFAEVNHERKIFCSHGDETFPGIIVRFAIESVDCGIARPLCLGRKAFDGPKRIVASWGWRFI